jgi:hypothetical protein
VSSDFRNTGTPGNFSIRLSQSVTLPDECVALVDNITCDNMFYTVTSNHNDRLYVAENVGGAITLRTITIPQGNYSLVAFASALATGLKANAPITNPYIVIPELAENNVSISATGLTFNILSDEQIQNHDGTLLLIDKANSRSCNKIIKNTTNGNTASSPSNYNYVVTFVSGFASLLPVRNIFVHSNLSDNSVLTPQGLGDCICAIPVSGGFATTIHHNMTSHADAINVSRRAFDSLTFQLRDGHGNLLNMDDGFFSCSIIFMIKNN